MRQGKFQCPECNERFEIKEIQVHEMESACGTDLDWAPLARCQSCDELQNPIQMQWANCLSCFSSSAQARSELKTVMGQRLDQYGTFDRLTEENLAAIEVFLESWVSGFDSRIQGLLAALFLSALLPPARIHAFHNSEGDFLSELTLGSLEKIRQDAWLPRDSGDTHQVLAIESWFESFKDASMFPAYSDLLFGPLYQTASNSGRHWGFSEHGVFDLRLFDQLWGQGFSKGISLRAISTQLMLTPVEVGEKIEYLRDALSGGTNSYNLRFLEARESRNQELTIARINDVLGLDIKLSGAEAEAILEELGDIDALIAFYRIDREMSEFEISKLVSETEQHVRASLQRTIEKLNLKIQ